MFEDWWGGQEVNNAIKRDASRCNKCFFSHLGRRLKSEIEVDGPLVLVSNDSCTAAYGEPGAPNFPGVYSCQINGGWCEAGVTGSAWLTFTATEGNCWITACTPAGCSSSPRR